MALTKPKLSQNIDTDSAVFTDPVLVLHQGATSANTDVGFLFNRANGLVSNAAVIWQESTRSFVHILTPSSGAPDANLTVSTYANVAVGNVLLINNAGIYVNGTIGSAGQVLASDGAKTFWAAPGGFTGGTVPNPTVFQSNLVISNTTSSISTVTGALVVAGGIGVANDIRSGGAIVPDADNTGFVGNATNTWANGQFTNLTVDSTLNVRAAIDLADSDILRFGSSDDWEFFHDGTDNYIDLNVGDLRIRDNSTQRVSLSRTTGNLVLDSTTTSISTTTGALVVQGGIGVAGNIYTGKLYTTDGLFWAGNGNVIVTGSGSGGTIGFINSTVTTFPTGNYGDFSATRDAFGVHIDTAYDCMEPNGSYVTVDLNT